MNKKEFVFKNPQRPAAMEKARPQPYEPEWARINREPTREFVDPQEVQQAVAINAATIGAISRRGGLPLPPPPQPSLAGSPTPLRYTANRQPPKLPKQMPFAHVPNHFGTPTDQQDIFVPAEPQFRPASWEVNGATSDIKADDVKIPDQYVKHMAVSSSDQDFESSWNMVQQAPAIPFNTCLKCGRNGHVGEQYCSTCGAPIAPVIPESHEATVSDEVDSPEHLLDVEVGTFCIAVRDQLVQVDSQEEAVELIEYILDGTDEQFKGIKMDEIAIFKRLDLQFGFHIKE